MKRFKLSSLLFLTLVSVSSISHADTFEPNTHYQVCFTPGYDCTQKIVDVIDQAKTSILVQAYSFTSRPIGRALLEAKDRGVEIKVILDKSQYVPNGYSSAQFFANKDIPVRIDNEVAIAHNKVMVIDDNIIITGSFNFTRAAQEQNAENVLIIESPKLAKQYSENWYRRQRVSKPLSFYKIYHGVEKTMPAHYSRKPKSMSDVLLQLIRKELKW